jgi:hypothetical protein
MFQSASRTSALEEQKNQPPLFFAYYNLTTRTSTAKGGKITEEMAAFPTSYSHNA